jgi:hypothetical protein
MGAHFPAFPSGTPTGRAFLPIVLLDGTLVGSLAPLIVHGTSTRAVRGGYVVAHGPTVGAGRDWQWSLVHGAICLPFSVSVHLLKPSDKKAAATIVRIGALSSTIKTVLPAPCFLGITLGFPRSRRLVPIGVIESIPLKSP